MNRPNFVGAGLAPARKGFNCRGTAVPCPMWAASRAAPTIFNSLGTARRDLTKYNSMEES